MLRIVDNSKWIRPDFTSSCESRVDACLGMICVLVEVSFVSNISAFRDNHNVVFSANERDWLAYAFY